MADVTQIISRIAQSDTSAPLPGPSSAAARFHTGPLPGDFGKRPPHKVLAVVFRTKQGDFGLITCYAQLVVIDLKGLVGVVPSKR